MSINYAIILKPWNSSHSIVQKTGDKIKLQRERETCILQLILHFVTSSPPPPPHPPLKEEVEEKSKIKTTVGNETLWAEH